MSKRWKIKEQKIERANEISKKYNISDLVSKILSHKNLNDEEIEKFLKPTRKDFYDPFLMPDMDKAIDRIEKAIKEKEKIIIYGDYDADGITSTVILKRFFKDRNIELDTYIPNRLDEGYGLNKKAVEKITKDGYTLMITVDCGITSIEEVDYAKELGLDIVITDHHETLDKLPNGVAVVDCKREDNKYPFQLLAGCGVAFKLIQAYCQKFNINENECLKYLDIVSVGTISDIVPLVDENRVIAKLGLMLIKQTKNLGIKEILNLSGYKKIDSTTISFGVSPRINACGRMGNASVAVKLLLENDEKKAYELAQNLDLLNTKRQEVEKQIYSEAIEMIENKGLENKNSIVLYGKSWHNGVIGIVASRLVNIYNKPVILLTKENGMVRGSGRCPQGFSLYDALSKCTDKLIQFGGHELAAGLTVSEEKIDEFILAFESIATKKAADFAEQVLDIDLELTLKDLNVQLLKDMNILKPYGQANPSPVFLYRGLKIQAIRTIKDDKHLKLILKDSNKLIDAVAFSQGDRRDEIKIGDKIDVVCTVDVNTFTTPKTIELIIQDFKKSLN